MSRPFLMTVAAMLCGLTTASVTVARVPVPAPEARATAHVPRIASVMGHRTAHRAERATAAALRQVPQPHASNARRRVPLASRLSYSALASTDGGGDRSGNDGDGLDASDARTGVASDRAAPCETIIGIEQVPDTTDAVTAQIVVRYGEVVGTGTCAQAGSGTTFQFTVNGVDQTSAFTFDVDTSGLNVATATLLPLTLGTNTLVATTDGATDAVTATAIVFVPTYGLEVTADTALITLGQTENTGRLLRVHNTSTVPVTYDMSCTWTGPAACLQGISPPVLMLPAGSDTSLMLGIFAQNAAGAGELTVRAVGRRGPSASVIIRANVVRRGSTLASMVGDKVVRSACPTIGAGPGSAVQCGDLLVAHSLPGYRSLNEARGVTLVYNSQAANPLPVIAVDYLSYANEPAASLYRVTVSRASDSTTLAQMHYESTTDPAARVPHRFVVPIDVPALGLGTGAIPVRVIITARENGAWVDKSEQTTRLITVDRRTSPFGAGWWPAGVERLYANSTTGGALVVLGDGSALNYVAAASGGFQSPAGDYAMLSRTTSGGYLRTLADRRTFVWYSATGLIDSIGDNNPVRNVARYSWSPAALDGARLDSIRDPVGRATHFLYDSATGRVRAIKSYAIDTVRLVTSVHAGSVYADLDIIIDPDSLPTPFFYNGAPHRMTGHKPRAHGVFGFHYTTLGTVDSLIGGGGLTRRSVRAWQTVGAPLGSLDGSLIAPARRGMPDTVTTFIDIFIKTDTVPPHRPIWGRDVTFRVDRFGAVTNVAPVATAGLWITRDSLGQPVQILTAAGALINVDWADGLPVREYVAVNEIGKYTRYDTTSYGYHPTWRSLARVTRPMGDSVTIQYDSYGRRSGTIDAVGFETTFTYTPRGQVATITEPNEDGTGADLLPTIYSYDSLSLNLERVERGSAHTTYGYDSTYQSDLVRVEDASGSFTQASYDRVKRPRFVTQCCAASTYPSVTVETRYDDANRSRAQVGPSVDANGAVATPVATTATDALGRVILSCTAAGQCERTWYNERGLVEWMQQRNGYNTTYTYDDVGRLVERLVGYSTMTLKAADTVRYEYDAAGNTTAIDNRVSRIRRYFDEHGRLSYESQAIRELADTATRYHQIEAVHRFDRNGRRRATLIDEALRDSLVNCQKVIEFEEVPNCGGIKVGRDSVRYRYTTRDLVDMISNTYLRYNATRAHALWSYDWNAKQQVKTVTLPLSGVTQRSTYDAQGWLETYEAVGVLPQETLTRDAVGRVTRYAAPGRVDDYRFDGLGRLAQTTSTHGAVPDDDSLVYDPAGNRLADGTWRYGYNTVGQLVWKQRGVMGTGACQLDYRYDTMGNQTESRWGPGSPGCDDGETPRRLEYDHAGRMVATTTYPMVSGARVTETRRFWYDGLGRRILLVSDSTSSRDQGVWRYWWLDEHVAVKTHNPIGPVGANVHWPRLARDTDAGKQLRGTGEWFFYGPGTDNVLASWNHLQQATATHYFVADYRGTVVQVVDGQGAAQARAAETYTPFGTPAGTNAGAADGNPGYNGQEATGGLVYMRNRWYDPNTGRFTQVDPIGFAGGMNLYAYAGNDPVTYSDPFGLCPKDAGGDGETDSYSDCPEGSAGFYANRDAEGNGGLLNDARGAFASCRESSSCRTVAGVGAVVVGGYAALKLAAMAMPAMAATGIATNAEVVAFAKVAQWGGAAAGAASRIGSITAAEARAMDPQMVQRVKAFYENAAANNLGGSTAPLRAQLMAKILELQK